MSGSFLFLGVNIVKKKVFYRLKDIPSYKKKKVNKTFFYVKITNFMDSGKDGYYRCSKHFYYQYRNMERNEKRQEETYRKHFFLVDMVEDIIDEHSQNFIEQIDMQEKREKILLFIKSCNPSHRLIIELILKGISSPTDLSKKLNIPRTAINYRLKKIKENLEKLIK